jgi:hypothetical protein
VGAWRPGRRAGKLGGEGNEQPKANDRMPQNNNKPPAEASPKFDVAARSSPGFRPDSAAWTQSRRLLPFEFSIEL